MRVKGSLLKTRWEFLADRLGPEAPRAVLEGLSDGDRALAERALPASWVPFELLTRIDEAIVSRCGGGQVGICVEIGAFSARRNLGTLYRIFLDQARRDPFALLEQLALLHGTLYDWGDSQVQRLTGTSCLMQADYQGRATRLNCLTALGFYRESLCLIGSASVEADELTCAAHGDPRCTIEVRWQALQPR